MIEEEFIAKATDILKKNGCSGAKVCRPPNEDTVYLGAYSYMTRSQLVEVSKEILELDGYTIVQEAKNN